MSASPLSFSIITPTFNRKSKLLNLMKSVSSQLYELNNVEMIVVDDCSVDGTSDIKFNSFPFSVKYIPSIEKLGPAKARNKGIKESHNDIILFIDDDNELPVNFIQQFNEAFAKHPDIVCVGCAQLPPLKLVMNNIFARYEYKMPFLFSRFKYAISLDTAYIGGFETPVDGCACTSYKREIFFKEDMWLNESLTVPGGETAILKKGVSEKHKLLYIPIHSDHYQDYSLKGLMKKTRNRAIGELEVAQNFSIKMSESDKAKYNMKRDYSFIVKVLSTFDFEVIILFLFESAYKYIYKFKYRLLNIK